MLGFGTFVSWLDALFSFASLGLATPGGGTGAVAAAALASGAVWSGAAAVGAGELGGVWSVDAARDGAL